MNMGANQTPPGPRGLPWLGSVLSFARDPLGFLTECHRRYGDVVSFRIPGAPKFAFFHPDHVEHVLRTHHASFIKQTTPDGVLDQGLATSDGEIWRRDRHLLNPAFQLKEIEKYGSAIVDFAQRAVARWRPGEVRDINNDMSRLAMEVVSKVLFSADVSCDEAAVSAAVTAISEYWAKPSGWAHMGQWLPSPARQRFRRAIQELDAVIYRIVGDRQQGRTRADDLLNHLLQARSEDNSTMTAKQLRDQLVTLLVVGHETTAVGLAYTFRLLAQHPRVFERLCAELDQVLEGRPPTSADVPRLTYADCVVKESLRLFPPVWILSRVPLADCEIGGYRVPAGVRLYLPTWIIHRDPRWFQDAETFRPERWEHDQVKHLTRGAYIPFGDGPRLCIGNHFATVESILVLAVVAQRFRLELLPDQPFELLASITMRPRYGIKVTLHERRIGDRR
jgi:cytochrome P450